MADPAAEVVLPGTEPVRREDGVAVLRFDPDRLAAAEVIGAVLARHQVSDLSIVEPDLEGVIHRIYAARAVQPEVAADADAG